MTSKQLVLIVVFSMNVSYNVTWTVLNELSLHVHGPLKLEILQWKIYNGNFFDILLLANLQNHC